MATQANENLLRDIRDANINYLVLVQRMLNDDYSTGLFRSGLSHEVGQRLRNMSMSQIQALANMNSMICSFRLNDAALLNALSKDDMGGVLQQTRTTIALAQMPAGKTEYVEA